MLDDASPSLTETIVPPFSRFASRKILYANPGAPVDKTVIKEFKKSLKEYIRKENEEKKPDIKKRFFELCDGDSRAF